MRGIFFLASAQRANCKLYGIFVLITSPSLGYHCFPNMFRELWAFLKVENFLPVYHIFTPSFRLRGSAHSIQIRGHGGRTQEPRKIAKASDRQIQVDFVVIVVIVVVIMIMIMMMMIITIIIISKSNKRTRRRTRITRETSPAPTATPNSPNSPNPPNPPTQRASKETKKQRNEKETEKEKESKTDRKKQGQGQEL